MHDVATRGYFQQEPKLTKHARPGGVRAFFALIVHEIILIKRSLTKDESYHEQST